MFIIEKDTKECQFDMVKYKIMTILIMKKKIFLDTPELSCQPD